MPHQSSPVLNGLPLLVTSRLSTPEQALGVPELPLPPPPQLSGAAAAWEESRNASSQPMAVRGIPRPHWPHEGLACEGCVEAAPAAPAPQHQLCQGCLQVRFCSAEWLRASWPGHRSACQQARTGLRGVQQAFGQAARWRLCVQGVRNNKHAGEMTMGTTHQLCRWSCSSTQHQSPAHAATPPANAGPAQHNTC